MACYFCCYPCCLLTVIVSYVLFFFKQKTAYEMRISDWSSDVCSSDLLAGPGVPDVYQGSELWEMSLVDPDNRRAVDFGARAELLAAIDAGFERGDRKSGV